jgi:hypothetical protein
VSDNGAYEGEMNEIALFENALRAAVPTQPDARLGEALVPRLAKVARASTIEAETQATRRGVASGAGAARRRPRSRLALVARVGLAVAMIPLVLAGLAFAGVTVPGPARSAFDTVGITLPNQPASDKHGTSAGNNSDKGTGSTETETPKSGAQGKGNSAAAHQHALEQRAKARGNGKAVGHTLGKPIGLNGPTPPGHSKQTGPPAHSNAGGSSATHTTTHTPHTKPTTHGNANGHSK